MKKTVLVALAILSLLLAACGAAASSYEEEYSPASTEAPAAYAEGVVEPAFDAEMPAPARNDQTVGSGVNSTGPEVRERLVIMNADLTIVVADPQTKIDAIVAMAEEMGGFVVSMNVYQVYARDGALVPEGYISVRVPASFLDRALSQIKADAVEVRAETRSGQDVTQEYVDLESRLRSLEAAEAELMEIMENSTDTQDVLDVFNQLESYRQQIEIVRGQMQYFEQSAAYSLITVTIIAEETIQPIVIGPWSPKGAANDAIQDLIEFGKGLVEFLIHFFLYTVPVLIVIFGPFVLVGWGIFAAVRRSLRKKAARQQAAASQ
ncbi:MAG: DUF4349 domain-containing protein [Anaerolineales bacterium]|nr:DUF4349 domain-containing protein [Anaerolineales bacterium]